MIKEERIRSFVAIEIPNDVKAFINDNTRSLRSCRAKVKWTKTQSMHLTLKFLGEVEPGKIDEIESVCGPLFGAMNKMTLKLHGLGAFPSLGKPRVIWAGLSNREGALEKLVSDLELRLAEIGFPMEKRAFKPHLTIGRIKGRLEGRELIEAVRDEMDLEGPEFTVDGAALFKSDLRPSGPIYTVLREFHFQA